MPPAGDTAGNPQRPIRDQGEGFYVGIRGRRLGIGELGFEVGVWVGLGVGVGDRELGLGSRASSWGRGFGVGRRAPDVEGWGWGSRVGGLGRGLSVRVYCSGSY